MEPKLLVLDIDETLVFATETRLALAEDFRVGEYFVYRRPGLDEFVAHAFQRFRVSVWTSADRTYAEDVLSHIFPASGQLQFIWTRERCTQRLDADTGQARWIKNLAKLKKLGFALEEVVLVDDSPETAVENYGNLVLVRPFRGDPSDAELYHLGLYLPHLEAVANVRAVDKRGWRRTG